MLKKTITAILVGLTLTVGMATVAFAETVPNKAAVEKTVKAAAPSWKYTKLNTSIANPAPGGKIVTRPVISGNKKGLKYKYVWSYNNWQKWGVIKDFSTAEVASWTPPYEGTFDIHVDVKDSTGKVVSKSNRFKSSLNAASKASISKTTIALGDTVNLSASSTGVNPQYKFVWNYNNWKKWGIAKDFSKTNKASFKPPYPGKYEICVDIKDGKGNVTTKKLSLVVTPGWALNSVTGTQKSVEYNLPVILKANASGNTKGLKYKFVWSYNNWSNWGIVQNGTSNKATFTPGLQGKYDIYVDCYDNSGNVVTKSFTLNATGQSKTNAVLVPAMLDMVNAERAKEGLKPMVWDSRLDKAVLTRAKELTKLFDHTRPNGKQSTLGGEIIAKTSGTPPTAQRAMTAWMKSPGHRGRIMNIDSVEAGQRGMSAARFGDCWIIAFTTKNSVHANIYLD